MMARVSVSAGAAKAVAISNTTLTADRNFFKAEHVGSLFRLFNTGYKGTFSLAAEGAFTEPIRVTGIKVPDSQDDGGPGYNDRLFGYTVSGTWLGTLEMQRSFDGEDTGFNGYRYRNGEASSTNTTFTTNGSRNNDDQSPLAAESIWQVARQAGLRVVGTSELPWFQQLFPSGFDSYQLVQRAQDHFTAAESELGEQCVGMLAQRRTDMPWRRQAG